MLGIKRDNIIKKLIIVTLLLLSFDAISGWEIVSVFDGGNISAEPTSLRRSGHTVKLWFLSNGAGKVDNKDYLSSRHQIHFDCKGETMTYLYSQYFSQLNASGENIYNVGTSAFTPVAPGTVAEVMWKYACKKR